MPSECGNSTRPSSDSAVPCGFTLKSGHRSARCLSRCRTFRTDALGWRWLICIIFNAKIVRAAEAGLALFKTVEIAILDYIAQIRHSAPGITLRFNGRRENGCQSNDAERKKWKFHPLPHIPCLIPGIRSITMSRFGDCPPLPAALVCRSNAELFHRA